MYLYYNDLNYSIVDGTQSDSAIDVSQAEEECSFLKIENVISLAPKSDNTGNENPIVREEYIYSQYYYIIMFNLLYRHYTFLLLYYS